MRAVIKKPGKAAYAIDVLNSLDVYQALVGGYIEVVQLTQRHAMIVNEEGKLLDLPGNFKWHGDTIMGNAVFVGFKGDDFTDIDPDMEESLIGYWKEDEE